MFKIKRLTQKSMFKKKQLTRKIMLRKMTPVKDHVEKEMPRLKDNLKKYLPKRSCLKRNDSLERSQSPLVSSGHCCVSTEV